MSDCKGDLTDKDLVLALECEMGTWSCVEQSVFTCNTFVKYADCKNVAEHFVRNFLHQQCYIKEEREE
jgi:hypothetical protein